MNTTTAAEEDFRAATLEPGRGEIAYARVPAWVILHDRISPQGVVAYAYLNLHLPRRRFPTMVSVGQVLGLSAGQAAKGKAKRYVDELVEAGALERRGQRTSERMRTRNAYVLHWLPPDER